MESFNQTDVNPAVQDSSGNSDLMQCGILLSREDYNGTAVTPTIWVELIFYPILLFLCTVGNVLNLVVLGSDRAKTTTTVFLMCLAVSDMCVLWLHLPVYIPKVTPQIMDNPIYLKSMENFGGLQTWWTEACIQFSDWTLIVFSVERLIAISNPLSRLNKYQYCGEIGTVLLVEAVVFFLALIATVQNAASWYYILANDNATPDSQPWLRSWQNVQLEFETGNAIAKFFVLLIINIATFLMISKQYKENRSIFKGVENKRSVIQTSQLAKHNVNPHSHVSKTKSDHSQRTSFIFLSACVILYFFFQFPNVIWKCLEIASREPFCTYRFTSEAKLASQPFVFISVLANYSLNFVMYCSVCKKFRLQLRGLLNRFDRDRRRGSTDTVLTDFGSASPRGSADAHLQAGILRKHFSADAMASRAEAQSLASKSTTSRGSIPSKNRV